MDPVHIPWRKKLRKHLPTFQRDLTKWLSQGFCPPEFSKIVPPDFFREISKEEFPLFFYFFVFISLNLCSISWYFSGAFSPNASVFINFFFVVHFTPIWLSKKIQEFF
jgi:hypothetical protein